MLVSEESLSRLDSSLSQVDGLMFELWAEVSMWSRTVAWVICNDMLCMAASINMQHLQIVHAAGWQQFCGLQAAAVFNGMMRSGHQMSVFTMGMNYNNPTSQQCTISD